MKEIELAGGEIAFVDDADYESLRQFRWRKDKDGYAVRATTTGKLTTVRMHRQLLGLKKSDRVDVDHGDKNRLNNQRFNLRVCTRTQNNANSKRRSDNKSGFKGVTFCKYTGRWRAVISVEKKYVHLGRYDTPQEAHTAYCEAAVRLFGEFASDGVEA